jgi:hypothetical protein
VLDEDVAGIVVTPTNLEINELDGTAAFTVALTSEPIAAVAVDLTSLDTTECTVPANVTLTAQNWRAGLALTVTAVDDFKADGDQPCIIETKRAASQDSNYADMAVADVTTIVRDDDRIEVRFDPAAPIIREPNGTATVIVRLGSEPAAPVALTFASTDPGECAVSTGVTLTPTNWRNGLAITLTAVDDIFDDGAQQCIVTTTSSSGDADYNDLAVAGFAVTVEDDEAVTMQATVQTSSATVEIGEIVTYTYQVVNTGDVPLTVAATDSALGIVAFGETTLAPQATMQGELTRIVQESDLPGPLVTNATFSAQSAMGSVITATETTTVAVAANPQLTVTVLRLGPPFVSPNTEVTYQVTIINTGHIPAKITSIQSTTKTPVQAVTAQELDSAKPDVTGTATLTACTTPITIAAGAVHQCTIVWIAAKGDSDAVEFVVQVAAEGLLDFASTTSDSDVVIVSGPTSAGGLRIYLPVVSR